MAAEVVKGSTTGAAGLGNGAAPNGINGDSGATRALPAADTDATETREWLDSLEGVLQTTGPERARYLITRLKDKAIRGGVELPFTANTPYINTIPPERQSPFP